ALVEPLSPARFQVRFTASGELRDKLQRLATLTGQDIASVIDAAVSEKLARLEARRFARTTRPRKGVAEASPAPTSRPVPAPVRRAVFDRDEGRCTYVDASGRRCSESVSVEFHHTTPFARGGRHSVDTVRLACNCHN